MKHCQRSLFNQRASISCRINAFGLWMLCALMLIPLGLIDNPQSLGIVMHAIVVIIVGGSAGQFLGIVAITAITTWAIFKYFHCP